MLKTTSFVTGSMVVAISQAVNTRDTMHTLSADLAQTNAEAEGCGDSERGAMVPYRGPNSYAPYRAQDITPGLNLLAQTELTGQPGPKPALAQVNAEALLMQSDRQHTCSTAMIRNRNTVDDYLTIKAGDNMYTDPNFPKDDALYWKDHGESNADMANIEDYISWKRISDSDFYGNHSFFGPNGTADINPQDIN